MAGPFEGKHNQNRRDCQSRQGKIILMVMVVRILGVRGSVTICQPGIDAPYTVDQQVRQQAPQAQGEQDSGEKGASRHRSSHAAHA